MFLFLLINMDPFDPIVHVLLDFLLDVQQICQGHFEWREAINWLIS